MCRRPSSSTSRTVIVGGTGLYFRAICGGLAPIPPVPAAIRQGVREEWERLGPAALYARLAAHATDEHQAQHQCIDALAETIWQAQRQGCPPDGDSYLQALRRLAGDTGTK